MTFSTYAAAVVAGSSLVAGIATVTSASAQQSYPNRPIELVVTFGPGGGSDVMGRQMAQLLQDELGAQMPVSNIAGASGNAGLTRLRTSEPDGYTMGTLISLTVASWASGLGDNEPGDFDVVAVVQSSPSFLFVSANSPHQTAEDLFDYARENPGELGVATSGYGTQDDVTIRLLDRAGVSMENVPFQAPSERYAAPIGGHTDVIYEEPGDVAQFIRAEQLVPLVVFSQERHPEFPDVPTSSELGIEITDLDNFRSLAVPQGTSEEIVSTLEDAVTAAVETDTWQEFCVETYTCIEPVTGEEAQDMIAQFERTIADQLEQ